MLGPRLRGRHGAGRAARLGNVTTRRRRWSGPCSTPRSPRSWPAGSAARGRSRAAAGRTATPRCRALLDDLTLLDPAAGSGAFLLGALERLSALAGRLPEPTPTTCRRRILQRNLFGVDRSAAAVRLTELRLWLAVIAEDREYRPERVEPLPNLDCLIRQGDSLFEPVGAAVRLRAPDAPLGVRVAHAAPAVGHGQRAAENGSSCARSARPSAARRTRRWPPPRRKPGHASPIALSARGARISSALGAGSIASSAHGCGCDRAEPAGGARGAPHARARARGTVVPLPEPLRRRVRRGRLRPRGRQSAMAPRRGGAAGDRAGGWRAGIAGGGVRPRLRPPAGPGRGVPRARGGARRAGRGRRRCWCPPSSPRRATAPRPATRSPPSTTLITRRISPADRTRPSTPPSIRCAHRAKAAARRRPSRAHVARRSAPSRSPTVPQATPVRRRPVDPARGRAARSRPRRGSGREHPRLGDRFTCQLGRQDRRQPPVPRPARRRRSRGCSAGPCAAGTCAPFRAQPASDCSGPTAPDGAPLDRLPPGAAAHLAPHEAALRRARTSPAGRRGPCSVPAPPRRRIGWSGPISRGGSPPARSPAGGTPAGFPSTPATWRRRARPTRRSG